MEPAAVRARMLQTSRLKVREKRVVASLQGPFMDKATNKS